MILLFIVPKYARPGAPKAAVPKNGDKPIHGLVSDKNFIVANAVENILAGKSFLAKPHQIFASLPYFFWQLHLSS